MLPSTSVVDSRYQGIWWWILLFNCPVSVTLFSVWIANKFSSLLFTISKRSLERRTTAQNPCVSSWTPKCKPQLKANLWFSFCLGITWVRKILSTNWLEDSRTQDGSVHPFSSFFYTEQSFLIVKTGCWGRWSIYLPHYNSSYSILRKYIKKRVTILCI